MRIHSACLQKAGGGTAAGGGAEGDVGSLHPRDLRLARRRAPGGGAGELGHHRLTIVLFPKISIIDRL